MSFSISIILCVFLFVACCDCASFVKDSEVKLKSKPGFGTHKLGARYRRQIWMRFCSQGEQYHPMIELCCNGHVVPKVGNRTRCCGDNSFDPWSEMCCDDTTNSILPRMTQPTCCGSDLYDAASDMCCGSTVFYGVPTRGLPRPTLACCGDQGYDTTRQICCEETLSPVSQRPGALPGCCGSRAYDAASQLCCDGLPTFKPSNMSACCSTHAYNIATQLCCNNQYVAFKVGSNAVCCGRYSTYNPTNQLCCNGFPVSNRNPTGGTMLCCEGVMQPKTTPTTNCCGSQVYDTVTQLCCDGRIPVSKWTFGGGCGGLA